MGIKIKHQYAVVCHPANLYRAAHKTLLKGLRFKQNGAGWKLRMEYHLYKLHRQLTEFTYKHGKYNMFKVYDPKERTILVANISDRVVHHALHDVIEPLVNRKFIHHSYACRKGKGQHRGVMAAQAMLRTYDYFIHLDVKKYFYSIHRPTLLKIVRRTIKDEGIDWLLTTIIDSSDKHPYNQDTEQMTLFDAPKPDISFIADSVHGIPIGNLTSQLLANWYLNEVDQYVKHCLKYSAYIRYMDDFVLFSNSKERLRELENEITSYCMDNLGLSLHPSGGGASYRQGLTFLGFRIFRDHIRLKSASVARFRKNLKYYIEHIPFQTKEGFEELCCRVQSWNAHAAHGDTWHLRQNVFGQYRVTRFMMQHHFNINEMNRQLQWN
jgi:retron-type reverse transcriptase